MRSPVQRVTAVEFVEELEEPVLGGVEVSGQGGDLGSDLVAAPVTA